MTETSAEIMNASGHLCLAAMHYQNRIPHIPLKFKPSWKLRCVNWKIVTNFLNDHSAFEMSELLAQQQRKLESTETPL
jgi:hypothetical protein